MENNNWGRTILSVYNYLERITNAIDKIVNARALNSFYYNSVSSGYNDINAISDHILNLTERKVNLINLKLICEKALQNIKVEYARILISNFIDKRRAVDSAKFLNISLRSYFRKLNLALISFESELNKMGYNNKQLHMLFDDEGWIMEVKDKFDAENNFVLETISFNRVYNDYKFNHQIHSNPTF